MTPVILQNKQAPGDVVMLTAAVRDLHRAHPGKYRTYVDTTAPDLWRNNPNVTILDKKGKSPKDVRRIRCRYPLVNSTNSGAYHFVHGFRKFLEQELEIDIPQGPMRGDIHMGPGERRWPAKLLPDLPAGTLYWLIFAGGKRDMTTKWWNPASYQEVVDRLAGTVQFVQVGNGGKDWHPPLRGVINLVGQTTIRQLVRLTYHAAGVVCPITCGMHLAAAVPVPPGRPKNRACVVIAGGREPTQWEAYPHHQYLHTCGALYCCDHGGCWKSRCQPMRDGKRKDKDRHRCVAPVQVSDDLRIPRCMDLIKPADVERAVRLYYDGGALMPRKPLLHARRQIAWCGMKRSANHPALNWLVSQLEGEVCFLNNLGGVNALLKRDRRRTSPLPCLPKELVPVTEMAKRDLAAVVYSFEDFNYADVDYLPDVDAPDRMKVLILRDPYNLLASTNAMSSNKGQWSSLHNPRQTGPPSRQALAKFVNIWKGHAREFIRIRDADNPEEVAINYNRYMTEDAYRDELRQRLRLDNPTDVGMDAVPGNGKGSSFDRRKLDGRGREGKYFDRWKVHASTLWYREAMQDPELTELAREIFGPLPAAECMATPTSCAGPEPEPAGAPE